mgnify:CR=1 FL=1
MTFYRTTHATALLEGLGEGLELGPGQRHAFNNRDCFAAATLGFAPDAHDAVADAGRAVFAADTLRRWSVALGAQATGVGAVDEAGA